jgi:hypothetical protein
MRDKRFMRSRVEKIVAQENGRMEKLKGKKRYLIEKEERWGKLHMRGRRLFGLFINNVLMG